MTNLSATAKVRHGRNDCASNGAYLSPVSRRPRKPRLADHERYRAASGWWLAAWRDYRGLTLDDLALEIDASKGVISDLETGAARSTGGRAQRFNADTLAAVAKALNISQGWLLDVNPYEADPHWITIGEGFSHLNDNAKAAVAGLVQQLRQKSGD